MVFKVNLYCVDYCQMTPSPPGTSLVLSNGEGPYASGRRLAGRLLPQVEIVQGDRGRAGGREQGQSVKYMCAAVDTTSKEYDNFKA